MDFDINSFIELVQVAIGQRTEMSSYPEAGQWKAICIESNRQGLGAICFHGVESLTKRHCNNLEELNLNKNLYINWSLLANKTIQRNIFVDKHCVLLQKKFSEAELNTCIIKGQGLAPLYGDIASLRKSGDIDIWADGTWEQVMDFVNALTPNREFDFKHTHLRVFSDTTVEVHWWPSVAYNPIINKRLRKFYKAQAPLQTNNSVVLGSEEEIKAPNSIFNSIYILIHIFNHFLYEGITLKQLLDYYFAIRQQEVQESKDYILQKYKEFGVYDFSKIVMYILIEVFGMDETLVLSPPDRKRGQQLLDEIMMCEKINSTQSTVQRLFQRSLRYLRLFRYDILGTIYMPLYKTRLYIWKQKVIHRYKL